MTDLTLVVGLDVHKKTISVGGCGGRRRRRGALLWHDREHAGQRAGAVPQAVAGWATAAFAYEAGPCGYGVQRRLTRLGHRGEAVAPALIPRKVGDKSPHPDYGRAATSDPHRDCR